MGRTVNGLRKAGGRVGENAKYLVKKWKKVLPDNGHSAHKHPSKVAQQRVQADHDRTAAPRATSEPRATPTWRAGDPSQPSPPSKRKETFKHGGKDMAIKRKKVVGESTAYSTSATGFQTEFLKDLSSANKTRTSHKKASVHSSRDMSAANSSSKRYLDTPRPTYRSSHSASPTPPTGMSGNDSGMNISTSSHHSPRAVSPNCLVPSSRLSDPSSAKKRKGWGCNCASERGREGVGGVNQFL